MIVTLNYQSWMCFQPCKTDKSKEWKPTNRRITIDLGELEDFPIAFTVRDEKMVLLPGEDELSASVRPVSTHYRTDDGKIFIPFHVKSSSDIEIREQVNYVGFKRYFETYVASIFTGDKEDGTRLFQPDASIVIKPDNDAEIQDFLRRKLSEFRYFNHEYWIETTEPRYFVWTTGSKKRGLMFTSIVIRDTYGLNNPRERFFCANDFDGAKAFYDQEVEKGANPMPIKARIYVKKKELVKLTSGSPTPTVTVEVKSNGQYSFKFDA